MRKKVLFLCTGNSCRSQMAEAWMNHLKSDSYEAVSAGTKAHGINPYAAEVMQEVGIDITQAQSNTLDEFDLSTIDLVVSVCGHADQNCPVLPANVSRVHQGFDDPPALTKDTEDPEHRLEVYRRVRDEIRSYVSNFSE